MWGVSSTLVMITQSTSDENEIEVRLRFLSLQDRAARGDKVDLSSFGGGTR